MQRDEYADNEDAFVRHLDALGVPHGFETRTRHRFGLDRNTEEGALLSFSAALRPDNPAHRVVAWVMLVAFALPVLALLVHLAEGLAGLLL